MSEPHYERTIPLKHKNQIEEEMNEPYHRRDEEIKCMISSEHLNQMKKISLKALYREITDLRSFTEKYSSSKFDENFIQTIIYGTSDNLEVNACNCDSLTSKFIGFHVADALKHVADIENQYSKDYEKARQHMVLIFKTTSILRRYYKYSLQGKKSKVKLINTFKELTTMYPSFNHLRFSQDLELKYLLAFRNIVAVCVEVFGKSDKNLILYIAGKLEGSERSYRSMKHASSGTETFIRMRETIIAKESEGIAPTLQNDSDVSPNNFTVSTLEYHISEVDDLHLYDSRLRMELDMYVQPNNPLPAPMDIFICDADVTYERSISDDEETAGESSSFKLPIL